MIPLIAAHGLQKSFAGSHQPLGAAPALHALQGVSLDVARGETVAVVGESGSGKTTLGRCLLRLTEPSAGRITFDGADLMRLAPSALRRWRRRAQIVFQDPGAALNPRMTIGAAVGEPLAAHRLAGASEAYERALVALAEVGLDPSHADRYPHEVSGGQQQRAVIARALILQPEFLVLDEPVASLDVSVAAQVLNLLADLRDSRQLTYLLIAHDLRVVSHFADRVAVMYAGRFVEVGAVRAVFGRPRHPYTAALLSAMPQPDPERRERRIVLPPEPPSGHRVAPGCPFEPRCPYRHKDESCRADRPALREVETGSWAACHHAETVPQALVHAHHQLPHRLDQERQHQS